MSATWSTAVDDDGSVRLAVGGDIDLADERPLVDAVESVLAGRAKPIVMDLTGVDFIDSSGVRVLLRLRIDHGDRFCLGDMSAPARHILSVAGLLGHFGCPEDSA